MSTVCEKCKRNGLTAAFGSCALIHAPDTYSQTDRNPKRDTDRDPKRDTDRSKSWRNYEIR